MSGISLDGEICDGRHGQVLISHAFRHLRLAESPRGAAQLGSFGAEEGA